MSGEFIGGLKFYIGLVASPPAYKKLENLDDLAGFGTAFPALKKTNFDSTAQEFMAGLQEGNEFTVTCNRTNLASPNVQDFVYGLKGQTVEAKIVHTDASQSPNRVRTFTFQVVVLTDDHAFSKEDLNKISFSFKITGPVTMVVS